MKLTKKVFAVVLAMIMVFATFAMSASAKASDYILKFDDNGEFKIMMFADSQDNEELEETTAQLMRENMDHLFILKLKGLDKNKMYRCEKNGEVYSGALLMNSGINLSSLRATGDSIAIHFTAVDNK